METNNEYIPMRATHPFDILRKELNAREISNKDFAKRIGMQASNFSRMLKNKDELTPNLAIELERELGIPSEHWLGYMTDYLRDVVLVAERDKREEIEKVEENKFAQKINVEKFYERLNLTLKPLSQKITELKKYSNIIFAPETELKFCAFKKSEKRLTDNKALLTWIVIATALADRISQNYTYVKGNADKASIEIAELANKELVTKNEVERILNKYGIGYAHLEKFDKTPIDAYTTLRNDVPVIFATYRINDSDKFAFDILHELGHIALHIEKDIRTCFLNINGEDTNERLEKEADAYAQEKLIPLSDWRKIMCITTASLYPNHLCKLIGEKAKSLGYSPTIAVSRYKHDYLKISTSRSPKLP